MKVYKNIRRRHGGYAYTVFIYNVIANVICVQNKIYACGESSTI